MMNSDAIPSILNFIVEIEKLKAVSRKTKPVGLGRYENSAEHSWHVCVAALMLREYANDNIDIDRVIRMLLIHDLGEIDGGDTIIYESETPELKAQEQAGVVRLLDMLPDNRGQEYLALWQEFEAGESADAKYARAIDRIPPLLHNLESDGHSWRDHQISKERVFEINRRIGAGSPAIWDVIRTRLEKAVEAGLLR